MDRLFIFLDLEAAHGNNYFGDIIEIAAQVDPRVVKDEIFTSLINTKQNLSYFALKISKITRDDLAGQKYFPEVFQKFIDWVSIVVTQCSKEHGKDYVPVLVAHGGFDNDFVMIQSNLDRHEISLDILKKFQFADTYSLAKNLKSKNICDLWRCQLSIEKLLKHFYPRVKFEGQHRALPDVKYMMKIFLDSPINEYFDEIPIANFVDRHQEYEKKNTSKKEKKILNDKLPENMAKATHAMTLTRLLRNGLTYSRLISLFESAESMYDFYDKLKGIGIERKASKAIAAHLVAMHYCCRGVVEEDERVEIGEDEISKGARPQSVHRTDSGYDSIHSMDNDGEYRTRFYDMFVEDFMLPPEQYEYQFGSFTLKEIEELDLYIGDLFDAMFGSEIDDDVSVGVKGGGTGVNGVIDKEYNFDICDSSVDLNDNSLHDGINGNRGVKECEGEENWEDDMDEGVEFHLPSPAKDIPIGMTMHNVSGHEFIEKQPLLKYFDSFDVAAVPAGGLPKMSSKQRRYLKWENKKRLRQQRGIVIDPNATSGQGRTYGKTESGEIIILV